MRSKKEYLKTQRLLKKVGVLLFYREIKELEKDIGYEDLIFCNLTKQFLWSDEDLSHHARS